MQSVWLPFLENVLLFDRSYQIKYKDKLVKCNDLRYTDSQAM